MPSPMRRVNIADPEFKHFPDFPDGFRPGIVRLGRLVGATKTGISVYELPPGQAIGPYHYENPEDEWLLVLEGRPTLRHPRRRGRARALGRRLLPARAGRSAHGPQRHRLDGTRV